MYKPEEAESIKNKDLSSKQAAEQSVAFVILLYNV